MDGVFFIALLLYFVPSIVAKSNDSENTSSIFVLNLFLGWTLIGWVVALSWALMKKKTINPPAHQEEDQEEIVVKPSMYSARIKKIIQRCEADCCEAFCLLASAAKSDGRVSKEDLFLIVKFCSKNGTELDSGWREIVEEYSAKHNISFESSMTVDEALELLDDKPTLYLTTLYGTITAITLSSKRKNRTAEMIVDRLESMITKRSSESSEKQQEKKDLTSQFNPIEQQEPDRKKVTLQQNSEWVHKAKAELEAERRRQ